MRDLPKHKTSLLRLVSIFWPYVILAILVFILFSTNYKPGTWLTGWDNLHPEFDFKTNIIERSIWSAWQEYQGLGVRAGNAHAADLPRQIGLFILSWIAPSHILRYLYHFLALLVGSVGTYELIRRKILRNSSALTTKVSSLIGAIFYMLNLGTMQYFYVPYEAFSHFFASLPWLILALLAYLDKPTKKTMLFLIFAHILAIPMNYIPTIFIVYLMIVSIVLLSKFGMKKNIIKSLMILSIILCINAYWLFPFVSFVKNGTGFISEVKINRIFTEEAFLRNQKFGTIQNIALFKGFLFDTTDMADNSGKNDYMMRPWINFLSDKKIQWIHYVFFIFICLGYIFAIRKKKQNVGIFLTLFIIGLLALNNDNPPFGLLFRFLQDVSPLFRQVFRFPFTKFIVVAGLSASIGLAYWIDYVLSIRTKKIRPMLPIIVLAGFIVLMIIAVYPSFTGNFLYEKMRVAIPDEYFKIFNFFHTQPLGKKIANLPQPTFWGWTTHDWGYRGSGFPWYGIQQPILDRAFDVWNYSNEKYYKDLTEALYTKNKVDALERVFDMYGISYAWVDERVFMPGKPSLLHISEIQNTLDSSTRFQKVFQTGKQTIYAFKSLNYGPKKIENELDVPVFKSIQDSKQSFEVKQDKESVNITSSILNGTITIPSLYNSPFVLTNITKSASGLILEPYIPTIYIDDKIVPVLADPITIPIDKTTKTITLNDKILTNSDEPVILRWTGNTIDQFNTNSMIQSSLNKLFTKELHDCSSEQKPNVVFGKQEIQSNMISLYGQNSTPCLYDSLISFVDSNIVKQVDNNRNYLLDVSFDYQNNSNSMPSVCLSLEGNQNCFFIAKELDTETTNTESWQKATHVIPIDGHNFKKTWIRLALESESNKDLVNVIFRNLQLKIYIPSNPPIIFDLPKRGDTIVQTTAGTMHVSFPKEWMALAKTDNPGIHNNEKKNCSSLTTGQFERQIGQDPNVGYFTQYKATDASSCEFFPISNNYLQLGGITSILTRNLKGRPIKACLKLDPPGYCLFEDILQTPNNIWSYNYFITPSILDTNPPLFMEFDNYAVGLEERINDVGDVTTMPIPYDWLNAILISKSTNSDEILDVTSSRINPSLYITNISILRGISSIVTLSQSFDPGWKAYLVNVKCQTHLPDGQVSNVKCSWIEKFIDRAKKALPFLFGRELKEHVLVNNWANGWMLNSQESRVQSTKCQKVTDSRASDCVLLTVYLFFLPQLLEWLGFALLPIPFLMMWYTKKHEQKRYTLPY